jgi:uncharacterized protein YqgC (DUF456 family)
MKKAIFNVSTLVALLVPAMAFAQVPSFVYLNTTVNEGLTLLHVAITVITILLTVYFLISVLRFVMNKDATKAADLRKLMINGLIGLFVSVAVWGIIGLAGNITGVSTNGSGYGAPQITCPPGLNPVAGTCQ